MDVTFSNVLEGTRQYFLGLPKPSAGAGAGPPPPRPPSEPLEPEPHIIHKATVMREAAEKRAHREPESPAAVERPSSAPYPVPRPAERYPPYPPPPAAEPLRHSPQLAYSSSRSHHHQPQHHAPPPPPAPAPAPPHNDRVPPLHPPAPAPAPAQLYPAPPPLAATAPRRHADHYVHHNYPTHSSHRPAPAQPHPGAPRDQRHYPARPPERRDPQPPPARERAAYRYPSPTASTAARYAPAARPPHGYSPAPPPRPAYRPASLPAPPPPAPPPPAAAAPKPPYEYPPAPPVPTSPARAQAKPGPTALPARMTVSVTSLVDQMNQTKQKRESPLDLSVKTVKNSADSSTTQDDAVDSAAEHKAVSLQARAIPPAGPRAPPMAAAAGHVAPHKVDFAPDFQLSGVSYGARSAGVEYAAAHPPVRYDGYDPVPPRPHEPLGRPPYPLEPRHRPYPERGKYHPSPPPPRTDYVRIDLTRPEERLPEPPRLRDDRQYVIEQRKRLAPPPVNHIPEKAARYEAWQPPPDHRADRLSRSAREQQKLMSQPVYSYSSYQSEQRSHSSHQLASPYHPRDHHTAAASRYPAYPPVDASLRLSADYQQHYPDRTPTVGRPVIQKIPNHNIPHHHHHHPSPHHPHHHMDLQHGIDKRERMLSILRNSLETKHTGHADTRPAVIVIDDADDAVIEIKEDEESSRHRMRQLQSLVSPAVNHAIQMPKAVDSIARESEHPNLKNKSPENDIASRIRTKAELKGMPPPQESSSKSDLIELGNVHNNTPKLMPKSQKQHLFNQIREENLRLSVIKREQGSEVLPEVKSEPMNIEEIEKDAEVSIKMENCLEEPMDTTDTAARDDLDLDWTSVCDNFVEQLKTGCHKKKARRKRSVTDAEIKTENPSNSSHPDTITDTISVAPIVHNSSIVIKQEPLDNDETVEPIKTTTTVEPTILDNVSSSNPPVNKHKESTDTAKSKEIILDKKEKISLEVKVDNHIKISKIVDEVKNTHSVVEPKLDDKIKKTIQDDSAVKISKRKDKSKLVEKKGKVKISEKKDNSVIDEKKSRSRIDQKKDKSKIVEKKEKLRNAEKKAKLNNKINKDSEKTPKVKSTAKSKDSITEADANIANKKENEPLKTVIKEEAESTDDDEPLIKSKILKQKEESDRVKFEILKDLSEKSAYVKLECFDAEITNSSRRSLDSATVSKEKETLSKAKLTRSRSKTNSLSMENKIEKLKEDDTTSDTDSDITVMSSRLRVRKNTKIEDTKTATVSKSPTKTSVKKESYSSCSTPVRKPGFGDGSDFHPGWEEELYKYKRSLRMPTRLIAIPRGRSGGPYPRGSGVLLARGSTSLPDLDPAPLSPAPSSAPSAATDDLYGRRQDKLTLDSDLESNSSCSILPIRLRDHYDSEASTSTVVSSTLKKRGSSIVDVLIQKCGRKDDSKKKAKDKDKNKDDHTPKIIPKTQSDLLPTPSLGLVKTGPKGTLSVRKEKVMEEMFYTGSFRKETVSTYRDFFINNTDGLIGATEEFAAVVLKSRTRKESKVMKQKVTIKEVFGDDRPQSAPPAGCRRDATEDDEEDKLLVDIKKEPEEIKIKQKCKKIAKDQKLLRRSSSIRDGLRSTKYLKRNDAKGRLLRLKKRNNLIKSLANKRLKDYSTSKQKKEEKSPSPENKDKEKTPEEDASLDEPIVKKRFKRLFGRRKFSSGFDYIRKKKKIRREDGIVVQKVRRAIKPRDPESVHDIHKEIKGWFVNKSIGETPLHRAARMGYTDCVAYCLEKMAAEPSAKDNAGFTPLHVAAAKGHVRIGRLLLQYGANVSAAAQGGIRPLHEASENNHIEMIRLLLSYGADPVLGTYADQTPLQLAGGAAARLLRLHIADVQGRAVEPWLFGSPADVVDPEELGCAPLAGAPAASPPPAPDACVELQCTEAPLPPFYSLRAAPGQSAEGLWCLLQDVTSLLQIKSKDSLLKQIHCGSGSPKELLREIKTPEFLERAQCHQLLCAGEKVNVRASKVALVRVTDKLRQLLKVETVLVS